jgi:hypothetical protein
MDDDKVSRRSVLALSSAAVLEAACGSSLPKGASCVVNEPELFAPGSDGTPDPVLSGFRAERRRLWAFDEIHHVDANVYRPSCVGELAAIVRAAAAARQPITMRGGGKSLGEQSLGTSVVLIDAPAFQEIGDVRLASNGELQITCGAGARWGDVARTMAAKSGCVPRTVVTTGDATVGGTSVVDGVSRMSPIVGKESMQIRSFDMIDGTGTLRTFDDPKAPEFRAAITGYGAVGVMTSVTFAVSRALLGYMHTPRVETNGHRYMPGAYDWGDLLRSITAEGSRSASKAAAYFAETAKAPPAEPTGILRSEVMGLSLVCWFQGEGYAVDRLAHRYTTDPGGTHIPGGLYTEGCKFAELAEKVAGYADTITQLTSTLGFPNGRYVDDLCGFLFFLGNGATPAIKQMRLAGARLNYVQQTYVVPTGVLPGGIYDVSLTRQFLELVLGRCRERGVRPFSVDLLHLPPDTGFLSATLGMHGFAITVTFADHDERQWHLFREVFMALSHDLVGLGGRVHLVKNVELDRADLEVMYAEGFRQWKPIKDKLDPRGILVSKFYDRYFKDWSAS